MKTVVASLASISPYSQSRHYDVPKKAGESNKDHESRTWRERCHVNEDGNLFIPPMAFRNCISDAAQFLGMKVPGKGKSTYTKHFDAGILVVDGLILPIKKDAVPGEWQFVPSDGKRGGGSRVDKCFPLIHEWSGDVTFFVLDETVLQNVEYGGEEKTAFEHHLALAGSLIGIGRFRPRNRGYYGRFKVKSIQIHDAALGAAA